MNTKELLAKVRRIEIKTKALSNNLLSGQYHSSFKGKGMIFSEVRHYEIGDDIRQIDWNVTAKLSVPHIKSFEEEREMVVILAVDTSASLSFGSKNSSKRDILVELCATLAFSATMNNEKVGLLMFSDKIEKYVPPAKGKRHILRILRDLLDYESVLKKTQISIGATYLTRMLKKKSVVFLLSDYIDTNYESSLQLLSKKHKLLAIRLIDKAEKTLPKIGYILVQDAETGNLKYLNTFLPSIRKKWSEAYNTYENYYLKTFRKLGAKHQTVNTTSDYIKILIRLFK